MQLKARYYELRVFLALRPLNYIFGRLIRFLGPVSYVPGLGYFVNDPFIARLILKDHDHFSLNEGGGLGTLISELLGDTPTLLSMDGDEHQRVKYALLGQFSDEYLVNKVEPELNELVDQLVNDLKKGKVVDIARFTRICTNRITAKLLGVERTDEVELLRTGELVTKTMGCIDLAHQTFTKVNRSKALMYVEGLKTIAKDYYNDPNLSEESLIGVIKKLGYSKEATYGFIMMFIIAGTVSVSAALPRIVALLIDTESMDKLEDTPDSLMRAIDEGLRYITPGPVLLHGVKSDTVIKGHQFKTGRRVMVLLVNIMHSKKYNHKPNQFDINRQQNSATYGLWFGFGAHFCMGSLLAKLEIKTVLGALQQVKGLRIAERKFFKEGINPGYTKLIIRTEEIAR